MSDPIRPRRVAPAIAGTAVLLTGAVAGTSMLSFISERGDPVGLGQSATLSPLGTYGWESGASASGRTGDGRPYTLSLGTADESPLVPGTYENAFATSDFSTPPPAGRPYLSFRAYDDEESMAKCVTSTGRFEVTDYKAWPSGYIERLSASFEQRCEGATGSVWGQVDVRNPPLGPLTHFTVQIEPVIHLTPRKGEEYWYAYFVVRCNESTGGGWMAELLYTDAQGNLQRGIGSDRLGCGPKRTVERMDISAAPAPGPAELKLTAWVVDPRYGELGPYIVREETRRVRIVP